MDSLIGFAAGVLNEPAASGDSTIGYVTAVLTNPAGSGDSPIGWVLGTLTEPSGARDGDIGYRPNKIRNPHLPWGIVMSDLSIRRIAMKVYDGSTWR